RQHELRVALPLDIAPPAADHADDDVRLRTFEPGDEPGVLAVNNAAFAGHEEQGDWTPAVLEERLAQPWVDAALFVIADAPDGNGGRRVIGFNWLKAHPATEGDVARGEIYTIAVDPSAHGRGLGWRLAIQGLDLLHRR